MAIPTPVWEGEFKVQMINGSTGETEDHVGDIFVYFRNGNLQCVVEKSIRGLFAGMDLAAGPGKYIVFHADRPFLYLISEKSSGAVLFAGRYSGK